MRDDSVEGAAASGRNRRVALVLTTALVVLYGLAIVGVIVLN